MTGQSLGSFSGAQLPARINVPLAVKYEVEVLEIRK